MVAVIRPSSWNPLLFIHIFGAMLLVATMVLAIYSLVLARRRGDEPATRFAFRTLLMGVLPAYIVMRVGAQLIVDKEKLSDSKATWIGIGFGASDFGALLLLAMIVLTGLALRSAKQGTAIKGATRLTIAAVLSGLVMVLYVVAIYAMTAKPA